MMKCKWNLILLICFISCYSESFARDSCSSYTDSSFSDCSDYTDDCSDYTDDCSDYTDDCGCDSDYTDDCSSDDSDCTDSYYDDSSDEHFFDSSYDDTFDDTDYYFDTDDYFRSDDSDVSDLSDIHGNILGFNHPLRICPSHWLHKAERAYNRHQFEKTLRYINNYEKALLAQAPHRGCGLCGKDRREIHFFRSQSKKHLKSSSSSSYSSYFSPIPCSYQSLYSSDSCYFDSSYSSFDYSDHSASCSDTYSSYFDSASSCCEHGRVKLARNKIALLMNLEIIPDAVQHFLTEIDSHDKFIVNEIVLAATGNHVEAWNGEFDSNISMCSELFFNGESVSHRAGACAAIACQFIPSIDQQKEILFSMVEFKSQCKKLPKGANSYSLLKDILDKHTKI